MEGLCRALEEVLEWLSFPCLAALMRSAPRLRLIVDGPDSWQRRCVVLWRDKVYVPPPCRDLLAQRRAKTAIRQSLADLRRDTITAEELCSLVWSCRMKGSAGKSWTARDPWWRGCAAQRRRFAASGEVLQPADASSGEVLQPGGAADDWRPCFVDGEAMQWYFPTWVPEWVEEDGPAHHSHRPVARPVQVGSRVKIDNYPSHLVWRHPLNWGFVLDSPWSVMTSFELPPRTAVRHASSTEAELARTLTDARLRNDVTVSNLECDFWRSDIHVPRSPPAPKDFFAHEDEAGRLQFFIPPEPRGPHEAEEEDADEGDVEEVDEAEYGGESEDAEVGSEEEEESSIEQDVEEDPDT